MSASLALKVTAAQLAKIPQPLLLKITYVKCGLHTRPVIRKTLAALGLTKLHQTMIHKNVRPIRGMVNTVKYFVKVEPLEYVPKL